MITISRIQLRDYRGIKAVDETVTGAGILAKGRNGSGKSTVLGAIGAALAASDIGPDAVRLGEVDGEILIDLDVAGKSLHVRRRFGNGGSTLRVTNDDGDTKGKPAALLQELLGSSPLDVISVVLEKDKKKRRERILAALPVRVTVEQLRRWVPGLPDTYDVSGHGLEVVERLRSGAYAKRTEANRVATQAELAAKEATTRAQEARCVAPESAPAVDVAELALGVLSARASALTAKREAAESAHERTAGLRRQAEELREKATVARAVVGPTAEELDASKAEVEAASSLAESVRRKLFEVEADHREAVASRHKVVDAAKAFDAEAARAAELDKQAAGIEAGLVAAIESVTDEELDEAKLAHGAAALELKAAKLLEEARQQEAAAKQTTAAAKAAQDEADRLDAVVRALTHDAPAALLAETPGVAAGLELEGDEVRLGGISLDKINSAAQMRFAADIARALNPDVGFLVVDGLERLDPEQLTEFVSAATADGRQLFGSIVDRGDLVLAAIGVERAEAAE